MYVVLGWADLRLNFRGLRNDRGYGVTANRWANDVTKVVGNSGF